MKTNVLSLILYNLFLALYGLGIRIAAGWNKKAAAWLAGRKQQKIATYSEKTIWMHCSSLGEFEQGRPLVESIRQRYPNYKLIITFFSPSGYEIRKNYSGADAVLYLPMDGSARAKRFIKTINPALVLWVKYEYWYYYLCTLKKNHIPVLLVSGIFRKSQPFFKWYGAIWREMLHSFHYFFVQNQQSKELLENMKFENVSVTGDTRFDRVYDIASAVAEVDKIPAFCGDQKVIVAGSTWEEDETELIHYAKANPTIKFIIAPHEIDPENLADVKKEFPGSIFYSELNDTNSDAQTLIVDNIGLLSRLYRYATITYVGGGFRESGIHNILEAAVYGKPVIFGPVYHKFNEAVSLIEAGGAFSIQNALELESLLNNLLSQPQFLNEAGSAAGDFVKNNRGATHQIMNYIEEKRLLTN